MIIAFHVSAHRANSLPDNIEVDAMEKIHNLESMSPKAIEWLHKNKWS